MLATKLYIPSTRENVVERPDLTEKLLSGVDRPGSFALLSGPAGFGKTTLLSDFVTRFQQPVAWVSLDEGDNDTDRFWTYLITACQTILDGVGQGALELLSTSQPFPDETIPTILINDFVTQSGSVVLVLDDYHEIQNQTIHASLQFLLDHLPDNLYIVISTRIDPPWPLARYRVRNQLIEIRAQDLRFNMEEATKFLKQTTGLDLSREDVFALEERTEGWIAGLQLAALSMQGRDDISTFVKAFTGSHVYVAEYLVEEVLQRQPEQVQTFLLQTSLLKRMNAGLCKAVTEFQDAQTLLQNLHRENGFVIPLDDMGEWFRYHHLFADLLNARLRQSQSAKEIDALQLRAAEWYEQNGFTHDAVSHMLAAGDFTSAAELVERAAHPLIFSGQLNLLRNWLKAFPKNSFRDHPHLIFYQFWIDVLQNKADLSAEAVREKEKMLKALPSSPENDRLRGELMAVICRAIVFAGKTSEGIRLAKQALDYLPADALASRARVSSAMATAHDLEGRLLEAEPLYQDGIILAVNAGDYRLSSHTLFVKGLAQIHYGQLREAFGTFQRIIDLGKVGKTKANKVFFPAGQGYIGLGLIHLEWNELETAENYLAQGMQLCRRGGLDGTFIGKLQMSRLRQAEGNLEAAKEEIQFSEHAARMDDFNIAIRQIQIELARGDVDTVWRWAAPLVEMLSNDSAPKPPLIFFEIIQSILARVYIARDETEKAVQLLEKLQATAEPDKRLGRLIEVYLLRTLAYEKQNKGRSTPEAVESIKLALELGEAQGYTLLFLEEGPVLIPLMNAVANNRSTPDRIKKYARVLLDTFDRIRKFTKTTSINEADRLIEQLTPRELEVLELLAVGDSNQTIADKLVITVRTVKKHTGNIYGKLNASSRIQAVTQANKVGLLPKD